MEDSDASVFEDDISESAIEELWANVSTNKKQTLLRQRDLFGNIVEDGDPTEQVDKSQKRSFQQATHHFVDYKALETYTYPTNFEIRDYQYNLVQRSFYDNLLVALPTGLGKTFIASTTMLNYYRWFPKSKIIFMAPTKPLVAQQIKACCTLTGIPTSEAAILLDKTRRNRKDIWESKRLFFTTPQVVDNDLSSGIVDPLSISLLVIDEAHRARGNYAYNNVVKFITRFSNSFRILGLTATPASDVEGVQEIIDNLLISKVELRTERSIDVIKYLQHKKVDRITVGQTDKSKEYVDILSGAIAPMLKVANERKIYDVVDPSKINAFKCMEASQRLIKNPTLPEGLKWSNYFLLQLLGVVGQCYRRLNIYGPKAFYSYFNEKYLEFTTKYENKKSKNKLNANFYYSDEIQSLLRLCEEDMKDPSRCSHPKTDVAIEELQEFFAGMGKDSRVIIFTEFRESALEIVNSISSLKNDLKPHIFIGQAKERDKFDESKFLSKKWSKKPRSKGIKDNMKSNQATSSENAQMFGMNQKLQKEIIKKFKIGEFNILVATSVGEEGLDIGEVDMVICYDSTSSPIKNVQRMGRTGRKRNGRVLLLFSSNEESKFDKAMGGYEYIQQHIMSGNFITLHEQCRIIPRPYKPIVNKTFVEVPEENLKIKAEDDEDEIIKIATGYMAHKNSISEMPKSKQEKIKKKFFMPMNVETGFRSASSLTKPKVQKQDDSDKDILDSITTMTSDEEESLDEIIESSKNNILSEIDGAVSVQDRRASVEDVVEKAKGAMKYTKGSLRFPSSRAQEVLDNEQESGVENERTQSGYFTKRSSPEHCWDDEGRVEDRGHSSDSHSSSSKNLSQNKSISFVEPNPKRSKILCRQESDQEDEVFDDGLDSILSNPKVLMKSQHKNSIDKVVDFNMSERDGYLTVDELSELYSCYFARLDPVDKMAFKNPFPKDESTIRGQGKSNGKRSSSLINLWRNVHTSNNTKALSLLESYVASEKSIDYTQADGILHSIIDHNNSINESNI